ncbi:LacI family DNA-binding transcriptional regulator [Rhizobium skierniewicense]|uniref:LacI family DNA-binding transcriptional regulator n=1 Tax=Rhizobium skierniewicense TaxID=984260 RepID=UPI001FACE406|nr:LacI family DNA-binding transcriptional regulator [Rhizobium skierniewicense]MCI9866424.1 LacI family DNA-binding transcriptional regulator [Rhizobium skierniewicense]
MNLKQLSQMLGISQTTISRALNGYPEVNAETRRKIIEAAQATGYRPNAAAQRLATGKMGSIGLVMPTGAEHQSDVHFAEFLNGLGEVSARNGFHLVIMPSPPTHEQEALRELAASGSVDGIYLAYMKKNDPRIEMIKSLSIPFIVHGRSWGVETDYPFLDVDNETAFNDATSLLLQLGHRNIALMNGPEGYDFTFRRHRGVEAALSAQGYALNPANVSHSVMNDEAGFSIMERLLSQADRPTAVICASTALALGAVRSLNLRALKPGKDISIIAHDDVLPLLKPVNFSVPLTTTRSSLRDAGSRIAERLIDQIKTGNADTSEELWKAELVVRGSTGPAHL